MYFHTSLKIKDKTVSPVKLANFLKKYFYKDGSLQFHLAQAKEIIEGKEVIYEGILNAPENEFITITKVEMLSDYEVEQNAKNERNKYFENLRIRGANGDVEAAIEFCKTFDQYRYMVSAFA